MRKCPECRASSRVYDSRERFDGTIIRRRRCKACGHTWATYETIFHPQEVRINIAVAAERLHRFMESSDHVLMGIQDEIDRLRLEYHRVLTDESLE